MATSTNVLVGYDGSPGSDQALRWAAEEARLRHLELVICHCWRWPYPTDYSDYDIKAIIERLGANLLDEGVARARQLAPSVKVRTLLMTGPAYAALTHHSHDADLVVVGSHERNELPAASTALQLPARCRRPVMVVRRPPVEEKRVVVGVDGSPAADAALGLAFEEAALRGWDVLAVYGWWEPTAFIGTDLAGISDRAELERACGARLEHSVALWRDKYPQVEAHTRLAPTGPREALLEMVQGADLLVVGDRGRGGLDPLLLGATSSAMLQLAPCAVAVVHAA